MHLPQGALYIAEVSRPNLRGAFGNSLSLSVAFGITFTMVSGVFMDWRTLAICCGILPLLGNVAGSTHLQGPPTSGGPHIAPAFELLRL